MESLDYLLNQVINPCPLVYICLICFLIKDLIKGIALETSALFILNLDLVVCDNDLVSAEPPPFFHFIWQHWSQANCHLDVAACVLCGAHNNF